MQYLKSSAEARARDGDDHASRSRGRSAASMKSLGLSALSTSAPRTAAKGTIHLHLQRPGAFFKRAGGDLNRRAYPAGARKETLDLLGAR